MTSLSEQAAIEVNGEAVSLRDVLRVAKWRAQLEFVREATDAALVRQAARERGIEVSDDELQQAADDFRVARKLHNAATTEQWLTSHHLSYDAWESMLEYEALRDKLRDALTEGKIEEHFALSRLTYDAATISRIVVADESVARELRAQIVEEGADFYALARRHSIDAATKPAGGYCGLRRRQDFTTPSLEPAIFGARAGQIIGALKTDDGWELVKIESIHPATLDETMRDAIKMELFDEWLNERRSKARVSVPLLDEPED